MKGQERILEIIQVADTKPCSFASLDGNKEASQVYTLKENGAPKMDEESKLSELGKIREGAIKGWNQIKGFPIRCSSGNSIKGGIVTVW